MAVGKLLKWRPLACREIAVQGHVPFSVGKLESSHAVGCTSHAAPLSLARCRRSVGVWWNVTPCTRVAGHFDSLHHWTFDAASAVAVGHFNPLPNGTLHTGRTIVFGFDAVRGLDSVRQYVADQDHGQADGRPTHDRHASRASDRRSLKSHTEEADTRRVAAVAFR